MVKSIKLTVNPLDPSELISDIHVEGDKILIEFLSNEGSDLVPFEDLEPIQLRAILRTLILDFQDS